MPEEMDLRLAHKKRWPEGHGQSHEEGRAHAKDARLSEHETWQVDNSLHRIKASGRK